MHTDIWCKSENDHKVVLLHESLILKIMREGLFSWQGKN